MITIEMIGRLVPGLNTADLERWIANRWIRPEGRPESGGYLFRDVDVARVRLIAELRYDLHIEEETLPVVLSLMDQLYGLRHQMRLLHAAIERQPAEIRNAIVQHLAEQLGRGGGER
jgi:chaperone modulatory protein CbpM